MKIDNTAIRDEALALSSEILKDLDLSTLPLSNIVLKATRLARMCGDFEYEQVFDYESAGYPYIKGGGVPSEVWKYLILAGRVTQHKNKDDTANLSSISQYETIIETDKIGLSVCTDPNISITSANPSQYVSAGHTNMVQRNALIENILNATENLANRRTFIYKYVRDKYFELKFSYLTSNIWVSVKEDVDGLINRFIPEETKRITTIYDNLKDDNPEKWSLALTSCRRMLKSLADKIYPPSSTPIKKDKKVVKVDNDNFINRLVCYIDDNLASKTSQAITNGNLKYIGERLDAINDKTSKGVHGSVDKDEAERCFMYTYLIMGDILRVVEENESNKSSKS